eukprot:12079424-Karenia_brevis.AAC.1
MMMMMRMRMRMMMMTHWHSFWANVGQAPVIQPKPPVAPSLSLPAGIMTPKPVSRNLLSAPAEVP